MKILFVGDVVGRGGRRVVRELLPSIQERFHVDYTIVNAENAAGGFGLTPKIAREILSVGVDVLTSGNHIWDKRELWAHLDEEERLLRPGNYSASLPGNWNHVGETAAGIRIGVANLQGRVSMPLTDCPFRMVDRELGQLHKKTRVWILDFHAEATSEKVAMGWFLDGRVTAVLGTHTHIPTADARILPQGTAVITDVGMTGSYESVIGMKTEGALQRFLTGLPGRLEVETESPKLCAVVIDVDEGTGRARSIQRVEAESVS